MSFERIFKENLKKLGNSRYLEAYEDRPHISKQKLDKFDEVKYLANKDSLISEYATVLSERYIAAINITDELVISVYDINSKKIFAQRSAFSEQDKDKLEELEEYLNKNKGKSIEVRLFGLQNGADLNNLERILDIILKYKAPIFEIDLFGNEIRHISIDMKIGGSFNILMENRLYRPGELINSSNTAQAAGKQQ
ncbi:MAG: hypothetical protein M1124_01560 [Candidatus Marsarchaeota archaeon]|nr:hypothetical protein [Candidatus Marsarchaeota archaeon]